jgi:monomeric isocitrate dehydrogenase
MSITRKTRAGASAAKLLSRDRADPAALRQSPSKYLKAADIKGKEVRVVIDRVEIEEKTASTSR